MRAIFTLLACAVALAASLCQSSSPSSVDVTVPRANFRSLVVGVPAVVEVAVPPHRPGASSPATPDDTEPWCSVLAHVAGAVATARYEARVSFAGSPPRKYEIRVVQLVRSAAPGGGGGGAGQSRQLLDTERVQFTPSARAAAAAAAAAAPVVHDAPAFGFVATNEQGDEVVRARSVGDDVSVDEIGLCVRIADWGFASRSFHDAGTVRFVLTVDEMLLGALPRSAVPSVAVAVVLASLGLAALLPRLLAVLQ